MTETAFWILFVIVMAVLAIISEYRHQKRRCDKCGGRRKLRKIKDPTGVNLSDKVTLSFWTGPTKFTETWKCPDCGDEYIYKYWDV